MSSTIATDSEIDQLAKSAVENARELIAESAPNLKRYDRASRKRFTRLFKDTYYSDKVWPFQIDS